MLRGPDLFCRYESHIMNKIYHLIDGITEKNYHVTQIIGINQIIPNYNVLGNRYFHLVIRFCMNTKKVDKLSVVIKKKM